MHRLAKDEFLLPDGVEAATPAEYVDPLTAYAQKNGGAAAVRPTSSN